MVLLIRGDFYWFLFVFLRSSDFIRYPEAGPRESLGWPPNSPPQK